VKGDMNGNPVPLNGDGLLLLLLALVFVVAFARYLLRAARERQVPYTPEYNAEFRRVRMMVIRRDHYQCRICGTPGTGDNPLEVHHIRARIAGGTNDPENLVTLCRHHHRQLPRG
jgi:5-methylcytosine-specific restriction endonuclease McrA